MIIIAAVSAADLAVIFAYLAFVVFASGSLLLKVNCQAFIKLLNNPMTDPIANLLTSIRNAYQAKKNETFVPYSRIKENLCRILSDNHYLKSFSVTGTLPSQKMIRIELNYLPSGEPCLTGIKRISSPSVRR